MELNDLYKIAPGLNIEGGFPYMDLKKNKNCQTKWVNLILVLDRPLIDNIVFDDIFANNKYPLLESAIDNLNEHHFLAAYLMIIAYYIENGRQLLKKNPTDNLKITIHIHQDVSCKPLIKLLKNYIAQILNFFGTDMNNIELEFRSDFLNYIAAEYTYDNTDILISLSQCAGLDLILEPGALIIPRQFIPYDIDSSTIKMSASYEVENDLPNRLDLILKSKFHRYSVYFVNENYCSENPNKNNFRANIFTTKDFHESNILQVNKLWNPTNGLEIVSLM